MSAQSSDVASPTGTGLVPITSSRPETFQKLLDTIRTGEASTADLRANTAVQANLLAGPDADLTYFERAELPAAARPGSKAHALIVDHWRKRARSRLNGHWLLSELCDLHTCIERPKPSSTPYADALPAPSSWKELSETVYDGQVPGLYAESDDDDDEDSYHDQEDIALRFPRWVVFHCIRRFWWCDLEADTYARRACRFLTEWEARQAADEAAGEIIDQKAARVKGRLRNATRRWYSENTPFPSSGPGDAAGSVWSGYESEDGNQDEAEAGVGSKTDPRPRPGILGEEELEGEGMEYTEHLAEQIFRHAVARPSRSMLVLDHADQLFCTPASDVPDDALTREELANALQALDFMQVLDTSTSDTGRQSRSSAVLLISTWDGRRSAHKGEFLRIAEAFWDPDRDRLVANLFPKMVLSADEALLLAEPVMWRALEWIFGRPRAVPLRATAGGDGSKGEKEAQT